MISFSKYLFESKFVRTRNGDWDDDDDHPGSWHRYTHEATVGNKHVAVDFGHDPSGLGKHYNATFYVNHASSRAHVGDHHDTAENMHILNHVKKTIHNFINFKKPNSINLSADDNEEHLAHHKIKMYKSFADHIAKRYPGADVEHHRSGAKVWFPDSK